MSRPFLIRRSRKAIVDSGAVLVYIKPSGVAASSYQALPYTVGTAFYDYAYAAGSVQLTSTANSVPPQDVKIVSIASQ